MLSGVTVFSTVMEGFSSVTVTLAVPEAETGVPSLSVPEAVTSSVTVRGLPGSISELK